jgi:hypothetical protein
MRAGLLVLFSFTVRYVLSPKRRSAALAAYRAFEAGARERFGFGRLPQFGESLLLVLVQVRDLLTVFARMADDATHERTPDHSEQD